MHESRQSGINAGFNRCESGCYNREFDCLVYFLVVFMRNVLIFIVSILFSSVLWAANPYHVSDEVAVAMHTGPSNQYRIKGWVVSGTTLQLLERNNETGYLHVRDENGRDGWIKGDHVEQGLSVKKRLPVVEKELAASRQQVKEQGEQLTELRDSLSSSNDSRAQAVTEMTQLQNEIDRLKAEIANMDETNLMGWFVRGGAVALGGLIVGLIVPHLPKRRRRSDDWF